MQELSLNILDIVMNSVKAEADKISVIIDETATKMTVTITDNGYGMSSETIEKVTDPFFTTRSTRKVGLGIPFFCLVAEQTGGRVFIDSRLKDEFPDSCGTTVTAVFNKNHIDFTPLGDMVSTVCTLVQGSPGIDFKFTHRIEEKNKEIRFDTMEMREQLGTVPLNTPEVLCWIKDFLLEQYNL